MNDPFYKIHQIIKANKWVYGIIMLCIFIGFIWTASRINFNEDISKLIPATSENKLLQKVLNTTEFRDKIIINIQRGSNGTPDDLVDYATQFLDSLNKNSDNFVKDIQGKVEDEAVFEALDFVYNNAPLFLTQEDYKILSGKTQGDSITKLTKDNYKTLISPSGIIAKNTIIKDPLGISLMALNHLKQLGVIDDFVLKDGFLVSKDENNLLLFITPKFNSSETGKNEAFSTQLYNLRDSLNTAYKSKAESEYFGGTLIAIANAKQIKQDIQLTVTIALTILVLLFIFFYRKITIPIILFVPTLFGGLLSITILSLIRNEISTISLGIGAVLLGVTLDYSLHILTHIRNNETIKNLFGNVVKPILMSSVTTALAFLCLLLVDSQALQDLGIFAAVSVLGASVFALIFIPQVYKGEAVKKVSKPTFIDKLALYDFSRNKIVVACIVVLIIASVFTYNNVHFNKDISKLNYEPKALKDAELRLDKITNVASKSLYVITYGPSIQTALEVNDSIYKVLRNLKEKGTIINFNSVGALVTSKEAQKQKIETWDKFWTMERKSRTKTTLIESGSTFGFKPNAFQEFYALLEKDFKPLEVDDFKAINTIVIEDFIASDGDFYTVTSLVKVDDTHVETVKDLFKNYSSTFVVDRQAINETLLGNLKDDFNRLILYCFIVILVLLFLFYRNLKLTIITIIPIVITWFITIGIMGLFNIEFNIFNIIISTFIFGLGIDYSIFITNGLLKEKEMNTHILSTYKASVLLSVITTILGVGVLIFAKHPALYSISIVSIIGIISAMFIAFTIQPLLFNYLIKDIKREQ